MLLFVDSVDVLESWIGVVKSGRLVVESVASIWMETPECDRVIAESVDASDIGFVLSVAESEEWISTVAVETLPLLVRLSITVWVEPLLSVVMSVAESVEWISTVAVETFPILVRSSIIVWVVTWLSVVEWTGNKSDELKKLPLVVVSEETRVVNDSLLSWRVGLVAKVGVGESVISFVVE